MKRRMIALVCSVLLVSCGLQSGTLPRWLQLAGQRVALGAVSRSFLPERTVSSAKSVTEAEPTAASTPQPTKTTVSAAPVINLSINNGNYKTTQGVAIKNGTKESVDVAALLQAGFQRPQLSAEAPTVLIYHTHTTESYADAGAEYSNQTELGVVGVGAAMKEVFERHGLKTLHLTEDFTKGGSFNTAYTRSLAGVQAALKKYPSIRIVLDVHRDSIARGDTECCPMTVLRGEEYAQVMVISGTDTLGLSHPDWKDNLKYGVALVKQLQKEYPGITRPLNLNANRYNTHTTPYALLVEVGGSANTVAQAQRSGRAVAESICEIVN